VATRYIPPKLKHHKSAPRIASVCVSIYPTVGMIKRGFYRRMMMMRNMKSSWTELVKHRGIDAAFIILLLHQFPIKIIVLLQA
jgi:hypothetical protein